ncbi:hypothetical protein GGS24DRAFT_495248 [Hypoxylon argillaceum]|nr:hypothetical protein GGS24DRAFT_495248 [Hypoxylon argillaceum]
MFISNLSRAKRGVSDMGMAQVSVVGTKTNPCRHAKKSEPRDAPLGDAVSDVNPSNSEDTQSSLLNSDKRLDELERDAQCSSDNEIQPIGAKYLHSQVNKDGNKVGDKGNFYPYGLPHPLPSTESDCYISALQENVKSTKILAPAVLTCIALKQTDSGNSGLHKSPQSIMLLPSRLFNLPKHPKALGDLRSRLTPSILPALSDNQEKPVKMERKFSTHTNLAITTIFQNCSTLFLMDATVPSGEREALEDIGENSAYSALYAKLHFVNAERHELMGPLSTLNRLARLRSSSSKPQAVLCTPSHLLSLSTNTQKRSK